MGQRAVGKRSAEYLRYVVATGSVSVGLVVVLTLLNVGEGVHGGFYSAIAQVVPVLLLADLLLFTRSRRLVATVVKKQAEIAEGIRKRRALEADQRDTMLKYEVLAKQHEELRIEAARLGAPIPPPLEPLEGPDAEGDDDSDERTDLDRAAGVIDGAMTMALAWAVAAETGALAALATATSSPWTFLLTAGGLLWLAITLAMIELVSFRVSTTGDAGNTALFW